MIADPTLIRVAGAAIGLCFGGLGALLAQRLPARYGLSDGATKRGARRRHVFVAGTTALVGLGVAEVLTTMDVSLARAAWLLGVNVFVASLVVAAAAIDREHMILPDELTLGGTAVCIASSPWRALGIRDAIIGAAVGFTVGYLPLLVYQRLRGQRGMGLGDTKLVLLAGAWHGPFGALFVLFAGALQSVIYALVSHALGARHAAPPSAAASVAELEARAAAGDADAKEALAIDPLAAPSLSGPLGVRLALGPFLALANLELLFGRRVLAEHLFAWLS